MVDRKVLRLGVIHAGKIIEERLVRKRQPITIGESPKASIILPPSAGVGAGFRMFDSDGGDYSLTFRAGMQGRISVDDVPIDFETLCARGLAKPAGDAFVLPLGDGAKGKIVLGDVVILFSFVTPKKEGPPLKLPRHIRSSLVYGMDWAFNVTFASVSLVFGLFVLYLTTIPVPEEVPFDQIEDRFARMLMPTKDMPPPEETKAPADKPKDDKAEKKPEKKPEAADPEDQQARRKEIQKQVAGKGVLAILGVKGKQNGAIADVFGEGKTVSTDIDSAFAGMGGVEVANGSNRTGRGSGGGAGDSTSIGALKTGGGGGSGKAGLGEKAEARVSANVKSEAPEVDGGSLDQGAISRVVKTRLSAIKECYERELKRNPQLAGKVVVRFTIDEEGRVTNATVEENTTGSKPVGGCIVERFERFRFPKPDGGGVTVSYPFIFTPSS